MPEPSPLELAVKLLIESGAQVQSGTTRFFAANGALLALLGALVAWGDPAEDGVELLNNILLGTCVLGAVCSGALGGAVLRQLRWSRLLRERIRALQEPGPSLLPGESFAGGALAALLAWAMTLAIAVGWILLAVFVAHIGLVLETTTRA